MTCTTVVARKWAEPRTRGSARLYEADFEQQLTRQWECRNWLLGEVIQVGAWDAECVKAGRSAEQPPVFPQTENEEVDDGSARWKIVQPAGDALISPATFTWTEPTGITATGGVDGDFASVRMLTVAENCELGEHTIMVKATCENGEVINQPFILEVV